MRLMVTGPTDDLTKEQHEKLADMMCGMGKFLQMTLLHSGRPGVELAAAGIAAELGWEITWTNDILLLKPEHALVIWYSQGLPEPEKNHTYWPDDEVHELADVGIPVDVRHL